VPPGITTSTGPGAAPVGTVVVISVLDTTLNVAAVPLKVTLVAAVRLWAVFPQSSSPVGCPVEGHVGGLNQARQKMCLPANLKVCLAQDFFQDKKPAAASSTGAEHSASLFATELIRVPRAYFKNFGAGASSLSSSRHSSSTNSIVP